MTLYTRIILTLLFLLTSVLGLHAQDTSAQEAKKARLEREIAIIDKQLAENSSKSTAMLSNLTLIRKKIANRKTLVEESDRQIRDFSDKMYLKQRQINRLRPVALHIPVCDVWTHCVDRTRIRQDLIGKTGRIVRVVAEIRCALRLC